MSAEISTILPAGLPAPAAQGDGLDAPYWEGLADGVLRVQRCNVCRTWQWGPEWLCHACLSFDVGWDEVPPRGRIYSWERVWHPVHPALAEAGPYVIVLVELPEAGGIRMVGNLDGDAEAPVEIGATLEAVFERHGEGEDAYTLVQWRVAR